VESRATCGSHHLFGKICSVAVNFPSTVLYATCVILCSGYYNGFKQATDE